MQWLLGALLLLSSLGILLLRHPVHASLSFLVTLLSLAAIYLELSAEFIAVMQVIVYAGAILVIFMFVIVLFQDAHQQIGYSQGKNSLVLLATAAVTFLLALFSLGMQLVGSFPAKAERVAAEGFGTVEALGRELYLDFFFPFEVVIMLFLVALVGALYTAKKAQ